MGLTQSNEVTDLTEGVSHLKLKDQTFFHQYTPATFGGHNICTPEEGLPNIHPIMSIEDHKRNQSSGTISKDLSDEEKMKRWRDNGGLASLVDGSSYGWHNTQSRGALFDMIATDNTKWNGSPNSDRKF